MTYEEQNKIDQLMRDVDELKKWKAERMQQQITFPLDKVSQEALSKYFLSITKTFITMGAGSEEFINMICRQGKDGFRAVSENPIIGFTATPSTDRVNLYFNVLNDSQGAFNDGDRVSLFSSDTPPGGLSLAGTYYVRDVSGTTVKLAATLGGAAINITDAGTGEHYLQAF